MSDDGTSPKAASVIVEHYCSVAGCGKWGGLGFAATKTVETRWWCAEHYPYWEGTRPEKKDV